MLCGVSLQVAVNTGTHTVLPILLSLDAETQFLFNHMIKEMSSQHSTAELNISGV